MKRDNPKEMLKKDSIESYLYIAMMEEKSQAEAIELIYNTKKINSSPVQNARVRMKKADILETTDLSSLRNIPFKSKIEPFLEHLLEKSKEQTILRKSRKQKGNTLNETDIKYLKLILDSSYYRSIFFNRFFFDNGTAIIQNTITRDGDKLTIPGGAFSFMEAMLSSIIFISHYIGLSGEFGRDYVKDSEITKITKDYSDPDTFVNSFLKAKNPDVFEHMCDYDPVKITMEFSGLEYNPQPYTEVGYYENEGYEYFLDKTVFSGLFLLFPPKLIEKLELSKLVSTGNSFSFHFPIEVLDYVKHGK